MSQRVKVVEVTNNPVPYRVPVYELIARDPRVDMSVIYCVAREPGRRSDVPELRFDHVVLRENYKTRGDHNVHSNPDVFAQLNRLDPDVVVTDGFNPTCLYAFAWSVLRRRGHVSRTDGTIESEERLSWKHRAVRRIVYGMSDAFLGASEGTAALFRSYGIPDGKLFKFCLSVDNTRFKPMGPPHKHYDLMFCSRLVHVKRPLATIEVAEATARRLGRCVSLLIVGAGELEEPMRARAAIAENVHTTFHGFASQSELPALYQSARVFLFPTKLDTWGVVVNEACAAGLPVILTPHAGTAGELVHDGENGFVRELDLEQWSKAAATLLSDDAMYARFSARSMQLVSRYSFVDAAEGWVSAAVHAGRRRRMGNRMQCA